MSPTSTSTVNGSWVVQDIPIISIERSTGPQEDSVTFGLPVASGTEIGGIAYGVSMTSDVLTTPPAISSTAVVPVEPYDLACGASGAPDHRGEKEVPKGAPAVGGEVDPTGVSATVNESDGHTFPNQPPRPTRAVQPPYPTASSTWTGGSS